MSIRKFRAARVTTTTASTFVGQPGDMFYDEATGQLKVSDGHTPGGHFVNLVVATATQLGGIKAGPGAAIGSDGTLTIDTTGLPLNIGDLAITRANISTVNANENLNLLSNGTGAVNIVGNLHIHTPAQGPDYPTPILEARNTGNVYVNGNLITNGGTYLVGSTTFVGSTTHSGNLTTAGNLIVAGASYFIGNITEIGNLSVIGDSVNNGNSVFNGNTTFNGNTIRNGATISTGNVTWNGTTVTNGSATNNGPSTFVGDMTVTGNITTTGNATFNGLSIFNGNTIRNGTTTTNGNLLVNGTTTNNGPTYNNGVLIQTGNLTVAGNTTSTGQATYVVAGVATNSSAGVEITGNVQGLYQSPQNLGVGLHLTGVDDGNTPGRIYNDSVGQYGFIGSRRFNGTIANPTQVLANQDIARFGGTGYATGGWPSIGSARITVVAGENLTATNQGARIEFWVTANGSVATTGIQRMVSIDPAIGITSNLGITAVGNISAGNIVVGGLTISNNFIYSTLTSSDITIGQVSASANIVMNRSTVHAKDAYFQSNIKVVNNNATGNAFNKAGGTVTANGTTGQITTNTDSLAKSSAATFTVNNSFVGSKDVVIVNIASGASTNSYAICVSAVANGSFQVTITNSGTGALAEALVINFVVIKTA